MLRTSQHSRFLTTCSLILAVALVQFAPAQKHPKEDAEDQSFYLGKAVMHPEDISGIWEAPDPHGGVIGIHLVLDASAPSDATTLVGTEQTWRHLQVGVYHRAGPDFQFGEENVFSDSSRGGSVHYENGRLTLRNAVELDLRRVAGDMWLGRIRREAFDSEVTLRRPEVRKESASPWLVGTWQQVSGQYMTCLHVVETAPGEFVGWSDSLEASGSDRCAPQKRQYLFEHYGTLAKVHMAEGGDASIELGAYNPMCCSHLFVGTPASNGEIMQADWPAGPKQSPQKSEWRRMRGNSCIVQPK